MKKRVLTGILAGVLALGTLAGCGSSADNAGQNGNAQQNEAGQGKDATVIKVAASSTPHAEILEEAAGILAEQGYDLQVTVFDDYVQPNLVVESEEFDANYFQHTPYLDDFNAENGTHIVSAAAIHVEPIGLYGGKQTTIDALTK